MGSLSKCYLPVILKKREGITEFISVIFTLFFLRFFFKNRTVKHSPFILPFTFKSS